MRSGDEQVPPDGAPGADADHARRRQEQEMLSRFGVSSIEPVVAPDDAADTAEATEAREPAEGADDGTNEPR